MNLFIPVSLYGQSKFDQNHFVSYYKQATKLSMDQLLLNKYIAQSKQGDSRAFRKVVDEFQSRVFSLSFRLLCNEADASDAVQETFIRVWMHLQSFNSEMRFSTWLYKIATNVCYDRIKALKRRNNLISFNIENTLLLN